MCVDERRGGIRSKHSNINDTTQTPSQKHTPQYKSFLYLYISSQTDCSCDSWLELRECSFGSRRASEYLRNFIMNYNHLGEEKTFIKQRDEYYENNRRRNSYESEKYA
jgi:hypothetical protein